MHTGLWILKRACPLFQMSLLFIFMTVSLSFILSSALTPLTLGLWVLLFAFLISLTTANLISSWFGLIIFLIYIGGLLVIFAYFSAVTPNQQLDLNPSLILFIIFSLFLTVNADLFYRTNLFNTFSTSALAPPITTILINHNIPLLLILGVVLFLALVAVVKVSRLTAGPLRPFI